MKHTFWHRTKSGVYYACSGDKFLEIQPGPSLYGKWQIVDVEPGRVENNDWIPKVEKVVVRANDLREAKKKAEAIFLGQEVVYGAKGDSPFQKELKKGGIS